LQEWLLEREEKGGDKERFVQAASGLPEHWKIKERVHNMIIKDKGKG